MKDLMRKFFKYINNEQDDLNHDFKQEDPNIFDEMENGDIWRSIGSHLYQDFKNRIKRQQLVQENLDREMYK